MGQGHGFKNVLHITLSKCCVKHSSYFITNILFFIQLIFVHNGLKIIMSTIIIIIFSINYSTLKVTQKYFILLEKVFWNNSHHIVKSKSFSFHSEFKNQVKKFQKLLLNYSFFLNLIKIMYKGKYYRLKIMFIFQCFW